MTIKNFISFLLQSYFNPLLFFVYLFGFREFFGRLRIKAFIGTGTNSERLNVAWYLGLAPVIYLTWFLVKFSFLSSFNGDLSPAVFLSLDFHWLQYLSFLVTGLILTVYTSRKGMEGNIMGFIFAPLLFAGMAIYLFFHFRWIWYVVLGGGAG